MLNVGQPVHDILELVLTSVAELLLNIIYENSGFTQAFLKEDFKFGLNRVYQDFGINLALMFLL